MGWCRDSWSAARSSRRTPVVDAATAALVRAVPRPVGKDGRAAPYVYAVPADMADGLRVGDATDAGFDAATVARLMNRVFDGTYPDVHAILVYRGGRLVVEEYFYGYDRERMHQMRSASKSIVSGSSASPSIVGPSTGRMSW